MKIHTCQRYAQNMSIVLHVVSLSLPQEFASGHGGVHRVHLPLLHVGTSHLSLGHADITTGFHAKPNWDADTTNDATHARSRPSTCMSSDVTLQDSFDGDMLNYSRTNERWADTRLLPLECGESSNEEEDKTGYMRQPAQHLPHRFA